MGLEFSQSFCPMTDDIFHVCTQLGEGLFKSVRDKKRIVTETALPRWRESNPPFALALEQLHRQFILVRITNRRRAFDSRTHYRRQGEHALESRRAFLQRRRREQTQQLGVVICILRVARPSAIQRREPRRMNPGRAIQRVHLQPRIIRQGEKRWSVKRGA